jgi:hypothetical protein
MRQVVCALFLLSLLLHAHANNVRKDIIRRKASFLESKAKIKFVPQQVLTEQPQSESESEQNDRFAQQQQQQQQQQQGLPSLGQAIGKIASAVVNGPNAGQPAGSNGRITGAAGRISNSDSSCVACQFFVQTMTNSMTKYSALFASMPAPSSQGTVTSYPPYYNPAAYRPPLLPYSGSYLNSAMNPFARIGMIEEKEKVAKKSDSFVQENELPQPDPKGTPPAYGTPRRYRSADMTYWRDRLNRIDTVNPPNPDPMREQARYLESQMFSAVYQSFEGMCASRVPELFIPFCQPMLDKFHIISEGLHYGDRPDQICMRNDFCAQDSYIRKLPHAVFNPHNPV